MDATIVNLAIYLIATFAAALVTGVAGFAFGLVAAAVWLHTSDAARQAWRCNSGCRCWLSERDPWRPDRPCRHSHDHLVWHSRLAQGRAARGVSADWRCDIRHERPVVGNKRRNIDGHSLVLRHRPSGVAGRDVGRTKALWTFGRSRLPQDRASPVVGLGHCAGSPRFHANSWLMADGLGEKQQT